jgi:hypothetical protein
MHMGDIVKSIKVGLYLSFKYSAVSTDIILVLNLGCLHPVACVKSGDGGFYPSTQHHYRRLIYYLYYYIATYFGPTTIIRQKIY